MKSKASRSAPFAINARAPGILAEEAKRFSVLLVHYSTDYVFDGAKQAPYTEHDEPNPINAYGRSKLAGERAIQAAGCRHLILRTSWVYASRGRNFLLTILGLAGERSELRVVDDQRGAPTWAREIARATADLLRTAEPPTGLFHLTATGKTTWCGFAREILAIANLATPVKAITTAEFPMPAVRPRNSVLSSAKLARATGIALPEWRSSRAGCGAGANSQERHTSPRKRLSRRELPGTAW